MMRLGATSKSGIGSRSAQNPERLIAHKEPYAAYEALRRAEVHGVRIRSRNRLTKVAEKNASQAVTKTVEYRYDVHNRRVVKSHDDDGAGSNPATETRFTYDGQQVALMFDDSNALLYRYAPTTPKGT